MARPSERFFARTTRSLLQLLGEPSGQEFSLGVCNLAAFDDSNHFAFADAVAEALAQLGNRPQQLYADPANAIGVWDDGAWNLQSPLQCCRARLQRSRYPPR